MTSRRTPLLQIDDVVLAAARLFTERGYANTRMQDIAAEFGVTHAALYYHFKSKEDVLQRINEIAINGLLAGAREVATGFFEKATQFETALVAHVRYVAANWVIVSALFDEERELSRPFARQLRVRRKEYNLLMEQMFRHGQEHGRLRPDVDSVLATNLLLGATSWVYRWYRPDRFGSVEEFAADAVEMLVRGFVVDGGGSIDGMTYAAEGEE